MTPFPKFRPKIDRAGAIHLSEKYDVAGDAEAEAAGKAIRESSEFTRERLTTIFHWKTRGRGKSRLSKNSDGEIKDALKLATLAGEPRSSIAVLCGLHGVDVPVASAVMTAIYPEKFTVIDFRAIETLGLPPAVPTLPFYLHYLAGCRDLAEKWSLPLRRLDRALWQWSFNNAKSKPLGDL